MGWYKRIDGTEVFKKGRYKVIEIYKKDNSWRLLPCARKPSFMCFIFNKGEAVLHEGVFGDFFKTKEKAVIWSMKKAKQLKII